MTKRLLDLLARLRRSVSIFRAWRRDGLTSFADALSLTRAGLVPVSGGADSEWLTGNAETVKRWAAQVWVEFPKLIYWNKFMGKGMNSVIQIKEELSGQAGDRITFSFARKLQGAGVTGDSDLENAEEAIATYSDDVTIDQKRNAIRLKGRMSERRTAYNQRMVAKELLTTWLAENVDQDIFTAIDLSPSTSIYAGAATSTATVAVGDYLTTALITKAKTKAKKALPKIWPVKVGNKDYYVLIIHPDQEHDLKVFDASWAQAQREAQVRGDENPLFEGSVGVWDGVIIHCHENIAVATTWGAGGNLPGAFGIFVGRQAGAFAWGERPRWVEKEFDYCNKVGFAIGAIWGVTKAVFNSIDHAVFSIRTYRTNN
jgi:N4-gp56 family major capsid protein